MKKIFYSKITKFIIWAMILGLTVPFLNCVYTGFEDYMELGGDNVYAFGKDFESSYYVSSLLNMPINAVGFAYMDSNSISHIYTHNGDGSSVVEYQESTPVPLPTMTAAPNEVQITPPPLPVMTPEASPSVSAPVERHDEDLFGQLENQIEYFADDERIEYYIKINDSVYTNCGAGSEKDLVGNKFYYLIHRGSDGSCERSRAGAKGNLQTLESYGLDNAALGDDEITVCAAIVDSHAEEMRDIWYQQEQIVKNCFEKLLVLLGAILILALYLFISAGRTAEGLDERGFMDKIWTEIYIAIACLATIGGAYLVIVIFADALSAMGASYYGGIPDYIAMPAVYIVTGLTLAVVLGCIIMCVRKLKHGRFLKDSILWMPVVFVWRIAKYVLGRCWNIIKKLLGSVRFGISAGRTAFRSFIGKKSGRYILGALTAYTALIGLCGFFTYELGVFFFIALAAFMAAAWFLYKHARELDNIRDGVALIRKGQLSHKIDEPLNADLKSLASDINHIAQGLDESVAAKLKAEKLKTELITNVSHDLKTPLTSIISYTELLSKVEGLPEEARDYIRIIDGKSQRLKNLTQDLFDISKVQSGNENIIFEKLDAALLIAQSLAEHDNEIKTSNLNFIVSTDKDLYFMADGKKMSRALGNLIENILKYSMCGTRVFINARLQNDKIVMEFKNIASYLMDFDADEIVGRFVRGDESRSTEGNGLGLAIVKSYVEACRGSFELTIDGDLFKVLVSFDKA